MVLRTFARIISYILHPLVMPTLGLFLFFNSGSYISYVANDGRQFLYLIVFVGTFLLPVLIIPFFIYRRLIRDGQMEERQDRILPLVFTAVFYYLVFYIFSRLSVPEILQSFMLAALIAVIITLVITFKWKISAHMIGIGGLTGSVIALAFRLVVDVQFFLLLLFLLAGMIGFARLRLNAHNPAQVYTGYGVGLISSFLIVLLY